MTDTLRTRILTLAMAVVATFTVFGVVALAPGFAQQANAVEKVVATSGYLYDDAYGYDLYAPANTKVDFNGKILDQDDYLMECYLNGDMTFTWEYAPKGGVYCEELPDGLLTGNGYCEIVLPAAYAGDAFFLRLEYPSREEEGAKAVSYSPDIHVVTMTNRIDIVGDPCANVLVAGKNWNSDNIAAAQNVFAPRASTNYKVKDVELYKKTYKGGWAPVAKGTEISGGYYKFRMSIVSADENKHCFLSEPDSVKFNGEPVGSVDQTTVYKSLKGNSPVATSSLTVFSGEYYLGPEAVLSYSTATWSGKVKSPSVYVRDNGTKLVKGKDYKVTTPSGRKSVGTYKYKVKFLGSYADLGTWYLPLVINPKGTTQYTPSKTYNAVTAKWKKNSTKMSKYRISGYQVRYSKYSDFRTFSTKTKSGYSSTSYKIKNLYEGTKYYLQVRTYKVISGKYYYSSWSSTKSVRTSEHQA